jgi:glycosyltransferase A (GT-A) superfamily protein (DUF2064 family)
MLRNSPGDRSPGSRRRNSTHNHLDARAVLIDGQQCPALHARQLRRIHKTLRVTPAMEAGISDHVWSLEEIAGLA